MSSVDGEHEIDGERRIDAMHDPMQAPEVPELDLGVDAAASEMLGDRDRLGEIGVGLGLLAACRRRGVGAPVVEDPRDVGDAVGVLHETEHEVIVLAAVESRLKAAELERQAPPVDAEMAGVHQGVHVLRGPSGLDVTNEGAVVGHHVLVAVEHVEGGVGGDAVGDVLEGVGGEGVVVVQQGDVVAGGECEGGVGGFGDAAGGGVAGEVDAGVGGGVALQGGGDLGVGGAVVDQAQLPVGVGLVAHGGDGLLEHGQGWVVDGGEHRDERPAGGDAAGCWVRRRVARAAGARWGSMSAGSTHIARATCVLGRPQGSDVADGELQRRCRGRDDEPNLVAAGSPAFGGRAAPWTTARDDSRPAA